MPESGGGRVGVVLITLFVVALLIYFIGTVAEVVVLLFISLILGTYFCAFTDTIMRVTRVPRGIGLATAVLVTTGATVGLVAVILPPVIVQTQELLSSLPELGRRVELSLQGLADRYPAFRIPEFEAGDGRLIAGLLSDFTGFVGASLVAYVTTGGKIAIELFSVLAMAVYFARDPASYREGFIALAPPTVRHIVRRTLTDLGDTMRAWIGGQLMAMTFLAVVTALGLWALQVPYALAFGVFTGAVALVPFFGTIISTALPSAFVLAAGGVGHAVAVLLLGVGIHLIEANVVYPLIFHVRIKLPPVFTILSVLLAASLLGVLGLVVAVPLLATVIVVVRHILIGQIYGDLPAGARVSAVLVPTQEFRQVVAAGTQAG